MARGRSLRSVARELGYSPSTLSKHLRNGVFRKLPQGGFDIDHVRRGLLSGTSPNQTHSVKLAAKLPKSEHLAPKARTPAPGISAQYVPPIIGYEDEDEEPVELPQRGKLAFRLQWRTSGTTRFVGQSMSCAGCRPRWLRICRSTTKKSVFKA
jgi:hypothetical protein